MRPRPKLLDLFCCQGGAGMGYHQAGFDVYGMDRLPQPRYPFPFQVFDVLDLKAKWIRKRFQAVHASPPCQIHTPLASLYYGNHGHVNLIPQTRKLLEKTGLPYIIENVEGARKHMVNPIMLCGTEFFLTAKDRKGMIRELRRHRLFESNVTITRKDQCWHEHPAAGVYGSTGERAVLRDVGGGGYHASLAERQELMEIDWMTGTGMSQAIPPAYTKHLGEQLIQFV